MSPWVRATLSLFVALTVAATAAAWRATHRHHPEPPADLTAEAGTVLPERTHLPEP